MLMIRSTAVAIVLTALSGGAALAATCNMTVEGAVAIDDEACTVSVSGGVTRIVVERYGVITVRGLSMRARLDEPVPGRRRGRTTYVSLGSVLRSPDIEDKTCYFGQKAVLCVE